MKVRPLRLVSSSPLLFAAVVACSSSSKSATSRGDGGRDAHASASRDAFAEAEAEASTQGGTDAHPDAILDPNNCVKPGTPSNADGIGGYCSPGAGQCAGAGLNVFPDCTADFGAPAHEWFCTLPCTDAGMCGSGAACLQAPFGQFCVPTACASGLGDASSDVFDGGVDATVDGASSHEAGATDGGSHEAAAHDAGSHPDGDLDGKAPSGAARDASDG